MTAFLRLTEASTDGEVTVDTVEAVINAALANGDDLVVTTDGGKVVYVSENVQFQDGV